MKISACLITKNEEKNLPYCLASVKDVASEIIVVDTGSTDQTVAVAKEYGATVYQYQWVNDFSKARNFTLEKAAGDWIIFLDADEYFVPESVPGVVDIINKSNSGGFDAVISLLINYEKTTDTVINSCPVVRIFKNDPNISYIGAIHERPVHRRRQLKQFDASEKLKIIHTGYSRNEFNEKEKGRRNLEILLAEEKKRPNDRDLCFYISETCIAVHDYAKALEYADKAITGTSQTNLLGIREKNYFNLIRCMAELKYPTSEITAKLREAIKLFPNYPDFYFYLGDFYKKDYRFHDAIGVYEQGLKHIDSGLKSQSQAGFAAANVIDVLGELYYRTDQLGQSLEHSISLLKIDRFSYYPLKRVLSILAKSESAPRIVNFIKKLYDITRIKDLLYLLKASLDINNLALAECFFEQIQLEQQKLLAVELSRINLLKGNYREAASEFGILFLEKSHPDYLHMALISAWLGHDYEALKALVKTEDGAAKFIDWITGREIRLNHDDKPFFLSIIKKLIKLNQIDLMLSLHNAVDELGIFLKVAEMLYFYELYELAGEFYNRYLERETDLPAATLADILIKMGSCLDKAGQSELALVFLKDAQGIAPGDYQVYEYAISICERCKDLIQLQYFAELGLAYYPDSNFLISALKRSSSV